MYTLRYMVGRHREGIYTLRYTVGREATLVVYTRV